MTGPAPEDVPRWPLRRAWLLLAAAVLAVLPAARGAAPANDDFVNRIALAGTRNTVAGSSLDASKEAGEPNHAGNVGGKSVWWSWTAPASGTAIVSTEGSDFDTLLGVYTGGTVSTLTTVASDDDSGAGTTSRATFAAVGGTVYHLAVDGFNNGSADSGTVALKVTVTVSTPANDDFADRIVLTGLTNTVTGANFGATKEPNEPNHAGNGGGRSVWWTWTAPISGLATLTTAGSDFDTVLAVYTGTTLPGLSITATNDDFNGSTSQVTFSASAGTTYQVAVDGFDGAAGSVVLTCFEVEAAPAISGFSPLIALVGDLVSVRGTNLLGTTAVRFNGTDAAAFTVNSSSGLTATVPAGATTGPVSLTTPAGQASSADALTVVASGLATATRSNATSIVTPSRGAATPYPSAIVVTGLTGVLSHVRVTLYQLTHDSPQDLDVLLVGPQGQKLLLMSDAGALASSPVEGVTLTFDDTAGAALPDADPIESGVYQPTDASPGDILSAPAPAAPYGAALSVFDGTNPNGTWALYVDDDTNPDAGVLAGGWSLALTTVEWQPELKLLGEGGGLTLSWPAWAGQFVLDRATNLAPPVTWTALTTNGSPTSVTQSITAPMGFFRLRGP